MQPDEAYVIYMAISPSKKKKTRSYRIFSSLYGFLYWLEFIIAYFTQFTYGNYIIIRSACIKLIHPVGCGILSSRLNFIAIRYCKSSLSAGRVMKHIVEWL